MVAGQSDEVSRHGSSATAGMAAAAMTGLFAADDPALLHVEQDPELL